ncbi:MAG: hypothetical protein ABSD21_08445 [Rhizomicrobium sp.]|jgi:hypothetical protein
MTGELEETALILDRQAKKLDEKGLAFAATLIRIAQVDVHMHAYGITEEEIDVLSFALQAIVQAKAAENK